MPPNHDVRSAPVRFGITCEHHNVIHAADTDVIGEHCRTHRLPEILAHSKGKRKCNATIRGYGRMQKYICNAHTYMKVIANGHRQCYRDPKLSVVKAGSSKI